MALSEDIELENVSQQQMMLEAIDRAIADKEVKGRRQALNRYQKSRRMIIYVSKWIPIRWA